MCGRYFIEDGVDSGELQEIIDAVNRRSNADQVKTSGAIFPTDTVPIINAKRKAHHHLSKLSRAPGRCPTETAAPLSGSRRIASHQPL